MQNRFRVRVWDIERQEYIFDAQFEPDYEYLFDDKKYIPEQCTGLRDKNDELIYESDILHFNHENYVVFYDEVEAIWAMDNQKGNLKAFSGEDTSDMEVVGNIHENSELFKNNQC